MDQIHDWSRKSILCKIKLKVTILLVWHFKSLLHVITKDVVTTMPETKE
jgi:hypothetical protein